MPRTRSQADKMEAEEEHIETMQEPERTAQGDNLISLNPISLDEPPARAPSEGSDSSMTQPQYPLRHERPPKSPSAAMTSHCTETARAARKAAKKKRLAALYEELEKAIRAKIRMEEESEDEDEQTDRRSEDRSTHGTDSEERVITWLDTAKDTNPGGGNIEESARPTVEGPVQIIESDAPRTEDPVLVNALKPCIKKSPSSHPPIEEAREPPQNSIAVALPSQPPDQHSKNDISELAGAITAAIRAAAPSSPPSRYVGELPLFAGAHTEWLTFRAAYLESASYLSTAENCARLRRALKGKAREAVASLLISSATPGEIMKQLEHRFGRPDNIASSEIEKLRHLPRLIDTPREIIAFANRIKNSVVALQVLGQSEYLRAPDVMKIIIEKLPPTIRHRWNDFIIGHRAQEKMKTDPELLLFSEFMETEAEMNARYAPPEQITTASEDSYTSPRRFRTHNIEADHHRKPTEDRFQCPVCKKQGHSVSSCATFKNADQDRRWEIAKQSNVCYRCLQYRSKTHRCKLRKCERDGCERSHHPLLHFKPKTPREEEPDGETERVASTHSSRKHDAYLKIVPVRISGPSGHFDTYALLDDGSTVTLIEERAAERIGAEGPTESLKIETIDAKLPETQSRRVSFKIEGQNRSFQIQARTIKKMKISPQTIEERHLWGCKHLRGIGKHVAYEDARPTILIGQDNWHLLIANEVRRGNRRQLVASRTALGWVLHGVDSRTIGHRVHFVNHIAVEDTEDRRMDEMLRHHFALESIAIEQKKPLSDPEEKAVKILQEHTVQLEDGKYETALLWKTEDIKMPNNYENALKRLQTTEKKIDRDPLLKKKYTEQMNALIEKGYAEQAPQSKQEGRTWYLPHFPVVNPLKPQKLRIVHDAAAKTRGTSLNDCLLTGPDLLRSLIGVMMRFRQHKYAVIADIAEMFMRVGIRQEDRDALRYLWRGDRREGPPEEYRMKSLIFGATCSPAIAIFVKNKNAEKHRKIHPTAADAIVQSHYMDDYLESFTTEQEAIEVSRQVKKIHAAGNFNLRNWVSNSEQIRQALEDGPLQVQQPKALSDRSNTEKVLGLMWNPRTDTLGFNLELARIPSALFTNTSPTKREVLKIVMSVYDPLGLAAPVTVRGKQIIQEIWRRGTEWDKKIDTDLAEQWTAWMQHMKDLRSVNVPRAYLGYSEATSLQLHVFVDASETTYAAALYWRTELPAGDVNVSLITAKARVAPLKLTSIPRLELQAAVLGARMAAVVIEEHARKPDTKTFWSDSKTVLSWIRAGSRSFKPFVAHRIAAIEELSSINEWRWVPTKQNTADDATRTAPHDFYGKHRWFTGPPFLQSPSEEWPTETATTPEVTGEERVHVVTTKKAPSIIEAAPKIDRFSSWTKLIRSTARMLQFIDLCRAKTDRVNYRRKKNEKDPDWNKRKTSTPIQPKKTIPTVKTRNYIQIDRKYIERAEKIIVRVIQSESFHEEIRQLRKGVAVATNSRLRPLSVIMNDDVIYLRSRVNAAAGVSEAQKTPAILDGNHRATQLWIEYTHRSLHHAGVETTINECRQHYWILRLRPTTRKIVRSCLHCRIRRATPTTPPTGNLPPTRLAHHQRPFTFTGIDYFGPLTVTVGRRQEKRYVALFTCLTTRAVHLEIAASLSSDSAILALRRMIARRGCPTEIWSDNGTNFHGASKELERAALESTSKEANVRNIQWRYIPPGAPFMGGAWERLVRSVKTALSTVLQHRSPPEEVLATLLAEAEYTVNSRPLTHVSVHHEDDEAITPNHFLLGGSARVPLPGEFTDHDLIGRPHWKTSQRLADHFWARWVREYLPELQHRREPHGTGAPIAIGDVVLIVDSNLPRNTWPRGVVIATHPGPDGAVRVVDLKTAGGVLRRPTKRLVVLTSSSVASPTDEECSDAAHPDATRRENVRDDQQ